MKALVLAAGIGSRLKPWTDEHPKDLVEVGGRPMLARVIDNIIAAGIDHIIVNVHHFAEQIIEFLSKNQFNARIEISDESGLLLDTGGALRKVVSMLGDEPVLIHNADILTELPLKDLIASHVESAADATLVVEERESSRRLVFSHGVEHPDRHLRLKGWINLQTGATKPSGFAPDMDKDRMMSFDGIHIVSSTVYKALHDFAPAETPFSIIDFYINQCIDADFRGFVLPDSCGWWDVGKPATLQAAREYFSSI